jgi:DnaK suppressor protein
MPAKKPSAKAKAAKKTVSKKAAPAKKAAVPARPSQSAKKHPAGKHVAAKPVAAKPAAKSAAPAKPVKPAPVPVAAVAAVLKPAAKPAPKAVAPAPAEPKPKPVAKFEDIDTQNHAADADDADASDAVNSNLLAGPRNVTPYQPKRGEQYMGKEQLEHFRQILSTWKMDLMEEVDRTVLHMKDEAANFPDPNDRATQESEFSLELRTRDRERKLIRKIDEAIKRIEDGSYGYCVETGEEIGIKRLEARPVATLCVEAQERRERREKQYGDRDDRYR